MKRLVMHLLMVVFFMAAGLSCFADGKGGTERPKYWPLIINGYLFDKIELALSMNEQMTGLMNRDTLAETGGMLFVYDTMEPRSFWMKNCRFDMDLLYMDAAGTVVSIHRMRMERARQRSESEEAYEGRLPAYRSEKPAQYALELAAGQVDLLDLKVGDKLELGTARLLELYGKYKTTFEMEGATTSP